MFRKHCYYLEPNCVSVLRQLDYMLELHCDALVFNDAERYLYCTQFCRKPIVVWCCSPLVAFTIPPWTKVFTLLFSLVSNDARNSSKTSAAFSSSLSIKQKHTHDIKLQLQKPAITYMHLFLMLSQHILMKQKIQICYNINNNVQTFFFCFSCSFFVRDLTGVAGFPFLSAIFKLQTKNNNIED